ncbi:MAG: TIGR04282 family arsenosugar biosynthesis glycosyltransferase [Nitrospiraceae bacterium]|nr:TIGR04282 family arsenosugar biosynthesis glycosyltransferase [Nitrospiraceae bacterium]
MTDDRCVILFVKLPERGKVKSRLAHDLDDNTVLRLYECMVLDTIDVLNRAATPFRICFDPPDAIDLVQKWLGGGYSYLPQFGGDLGERMEQAFLRVFADGAAEAILIGSDIPGLADNLISDAFRSFATHDAVLGPAEDGGYYLVGFKKNTFVPGIFRDMPWSTGAVFRKTVESMHRASRSVHVLPLCADLDTKEDLWKLLATRNERASAGARTRRFLDQYASSLERALTKAPPHQPR